MSMSADGSTIAMNDEEYITGVGEVRVIKTFSWDGSDWVPKSHLPGGSIGIDFVGDIQLSADGNTIAIANDSSVHVRYWDGSSWQQKGLFDIVAASDGIALSADGNTVALGGDVRNGSGGYTKIYHWNGNIWSQKGNTISEQTTQSSWFMELFTLSLNSTGDVIAIGSPIHDGLDYNNGRVRVFKYENSDWQQKADISGEAWGIASGSTVSLNANGTILAIGLGHELINPPSSPGSVRVFGWTGSQWSQMGDDISAGSEYSGGGVVSLNENGEVLAIGVPYWGPENKGLVRIYRWINDDWQLSHTIIGELESELAGYAIELNAAGDRIIVGSPTDRINGDWAGKVKTYRLSGVGINDTEQSSIKEVFPNPFVDEINIELEIGHDYKYAIVSDLLGCEVAQIDLRGKVKVNWEGGKLSGGVYVLSLLGSDDATSVKIIKQ